MRPALSFLLNTQVDAAVIQCDIANDQRVVQAGVFEGSKALQKPVLVMSTLIDRVWELATLRLISPVHIIANSAAAAAVEPDLITNVRNHLNVLIIISIYSNTWTNEFNSG